MLLLVPFFKTENSKIVKNSKYENLPTRNSFFSKISILLRKGCLNGTVQTIIIR